MRVTRIVTLVDKKLDSCVGEFRHVDDAQKKRRRIKCSSKRVENNGNSRLNFKEEFLLEIVVEKREIVFLEWRKYLLSGFIL